MQKQSTHAGSTRQLAARGGRPSRGAEVQLFAGLATSAVLHLLALQFTFTIPVEHTHSVDLKRTQFRAAHSELQVLHILIDEDPTSSVAVQTHTLPRIDQTVHIPFASVIVNMPNRLASGTPDPASLHDRLRTAIPYAPVAESRAFATEPRLASVRERVTRELHSYNDSVASAEEGTRRSRDWTRINDRGERWGISIARLNLGKFTVPLQYDTTDDVFRAPLQRREEYQRRILLFRETERQVARAEIDAQIQASLRKIRARIDAKRDSIRSRGR
jgi:hypothetical protein